MVWIWCQSKRKCSFISEFLWAKGSSAVFWHICLVLRVRLSLVTFGDLFSPHCGLLLFWTVLTLCWSRPHADTDLCPWSRLSLPLCVCIPPIKSTLCWLWRSHSTAMKHILQLRCMLLIHTSHCSRNSDWILNGCDYDLLSESGAGSDRWRCVYAKPAVVGHEWVLANQSG